MFPPFDKIFGGSSTAVADRKKKKREKIEIGNELIDDTEDTEVKKMIDDVIAEVNPPLNESEAASFGRDRKPGTVNIFVGKRGTEDQYEHIDEYRDRLKGVDSAAVADIRKQIKESYGKKDAVVKEPEADIEYVKARIARDASENELVMEHDRAVRANLNRAEEPRKKIQVVDDNGVVEISDKEDRLSQAVDDIRKAMSGSKTREKAENSHAEVIASSLESVDAAVDKKTNEELWQEQFKENNIVDEKAVDDKEEVFEVKMPHEIAQDIDAMTESDSLIEHHKAAEILRDLSKDEKKEAAVVNEMNPRLIEKLKVIDAPEFGRQEKTSPVASFEDEMRMGMKDKVAEINKEKKRKFAAEDKGEFVQFRKDNPDPRRRYDPSTKTENGDGEAVFEVNIPVEENKKVSEEQPNIDRRSSGDLIKGIDGVDKNIKAPAENVSDGKEELDKVKAELEVMGPIPPGPETPEKAAGFWGKAKDVLNKPAFWQTLGKVGISSAASILGVKSFYDVPAYFRQRYAVRGNIMGIGSGKGLSGSIEELLEASQDRKTAIDRGQERNKGAVTEALKDFDKRLAMTKEGNQKHSEQRKKLAKLLWENRQQKKLDDEKRGNEIDNILDNYTTTKISGVQAAREALNTAFVASGAFAFRGIAYGALAYQEKADKMRKEAAAAHMSGDSGLDAVDAKKLAEREIGISKVFASGFKETLDGIRFKTGKTGLQKSLSAVKSWGSVARLAGIALGVGMGGQAYGKAYDNLIDTISEGSFIGNVEKNFLANAERYIPNFGSVEGAVPNQQVGGNSAAEKVVTGEAVEKANDVIEKSKYLGGRSVWSEAEKQIASFRGTSGRMPVGDIDKVKDLIKISPEKYGLPAGTDVDKLTTAQLQAVQWDKAIGDAGLNKELPARVVAENIPARPIASPVAERVPFNSVRPGSVDDVSANAEAPVDRSTDAELKALHEILYGKKESVVPMNEATHDVDPTEEITVTPGSPEHVKAYVEEHGNQLSQLSKKVLEYRSHMDNMPTRYKGLFNPGDDPAQTQKIWTEIGKMRKPIEDEFGGKVTIDFNGNINLIKDRGESVRLFDANGGATAYAQKILEKDNDIVDSMEKSSDKFEIKGDGKGNAEVKVEALLKSPAEVNMNKGALDGMSPMEKRGLEQTSKQLTSMANRLKSSDTPEVEAATLRQAMKAIMKGAEEKYGRQIFNDEIKNLTEDNTVSKPVVENIEKIVTPAGKENILDQKDFSKDVSDKPTPEVATQINDDSGATGKEGVANPVVEKMTSGNSFQALDKNPMAEFPQKELVFAKDFPNDKRVDFERYFKTSLTERDEMIKQLSTWKEKYGDRPQYAAFEKIVRENLAKDNIALKKIVEAAAGNGEIELTASGEVPPADIADMRLEAFSSLAKLRSVKESSGDAFSEMRERMEKSKAPSATTGLKEVFTKTPSKPLSNNGILGQEDLDKSVVDDLKPKAQAEVKAAAHSLGVMEQEKEKAEKLAALGNERAGGKAKSLENIMSKVIKTEEEKFGPVFKDDIKASAGLGKSVEDIQKVERPTIQDEDLSDKKPEGLSVAEEKSAKVDLDKTVNDNPKQEVENLSRRAPANFTPIKNNILEKENNVVEATVERPVVNLETTRETREELSNLDRVESLVKQGDVVDLRNVPEVSKDVLRYLADQNNQKVVLNSLDVDKLDNESLQLLWKMKDRAIVSDEVFKKMEGIFSTPEFLKAKEEIYGIYDKLRYADWTKMIDAGVARKIIDNPMAESDVIEITSLIKTGLSEMKNSNDVEELESLRKGLKNVIELSERKYAGRLGVKKIYSDSLRKLAGMS